MGIVFIFLANFTISCKKAERSGLLEGRHSGLYVIEVGGKFGHINNSAQIVINPQFDSAMGFSEGLAAVLIGGKWGYIDKAGKYAINPQFDRASDFKEERAAVMIGGKWGYIDRSGKIVINPQFGGDSEFSGGLAKVWIGDKWGYIDTSGKYIWDLPFKEALKQHLSQAQTFLNDKNFSQALSECGLALAYDNQNEQALSLKQQIDDLIKKERIIDLLYRAQLHLNGGNYDAALGLCEEVLKYDPQNQEALGLKNKILEIRTILGYEPQADTPIRKEYLKKEGLSPEKGLLESYFQAISLKDSMTMTTLAMAPISIDVQSWNIVSMSEERVEPARLADLNRIELDLRKKLEGHVGPVMDAEDALHIAQEELKFARTGLSREAAKRKVDEAQVKFNQEREVHRQLQTTYNEAKNTAANEEQISLFSLGVGAVPNIRDLTGAIHSREVEVKVVGKDGQQKAYRFHIRRYELKDNSANLTRRGRWVIVKIEPIY